MRSGRVEWSPHICPVDVCDAEVPYHQLACPRDWYRLPENIRHEVNAAWGTKSADPVRHTNAVAAALQWYRSNPR